MKDIIRDLREKGRKTKVEVEGHHQGLESEGKEGLEREKEDQKEGLEREGKED